MTFGGSLGSSTTSLSPQSEPQPVSRLTESRRPRMLNGAERRPGALCSFSGADMLPLKGGSPSRQSVNFASRRALAKAGAIPSNQPADYGVFLPFCLNEASRVRRERQRRATSRQQNARRQDSKVSRSEASRLAPLGSEIRGRKAVAELGMTDLAVTRSLDHGPSIGIGEQGLQHQRVQPMAAAIGAE